jgi:hypothetical protein
MDSYRRCRCAGMERDVSFADRFKQETGASRARIMQHAKSGPSVHTSNRTSFGQRRATMAVASKRLGNFAVARALADYGRVVDRDCASILSRDRRPSAALGLWAAFGLYPDNLLQDLAEGENPLNTFAGFFAIERIELDLCDAHVLDGRDAGEAALRAFQNRVAAATNQPELLIAAAHAVQDMLEACLAAQAPLVRAVAEPRQTVAAWCAPVAVRL